MNGKKITVKQAGSIYVFKVNIALRKEDLDHLQKKIAQQIKEGCVVLPAYVDLLDVGPDLKVFTE